jgi:6-phosphogluconolactonase
MKRFLPALLLLAVIMFTTVPSFAGQLLYLASANDKTIVAYSLDEKTGKLAKKFSVELPANPGPLAFSPDGKFIYAAVTGLKGDNKDGVVTLARAADGTLTVKHSAPITSRTCYIRPDNEGRHLLAAQYHAGEVTVYEIDKGICTGKLTDQKKLQRTSHCVELDLSGKFAFVPHTSPNKVYQFRYDGKAGKLIANDPKAASGPDEDHQYHQPRHIVLHPTLKMAYTSNERGGGISAWTFDPKTGLIKLKQTVSSLPKGYKGGSAAADIRITPNGRFAYVSNRDTTKRKPGQPKQDTLCMFSLDPSTGAVTRIGTFPAPAFPRPTCIDLTGKYVFAAGQLSSTMFAYRINQKTGALEKLAEYKTGGGPIWVMCGAVKD